MDFFAGWDHWPLLIVKGIAAVGGFVVGYMFSGPLWRVIWRIVLRRPIPGPLVPWMKLCTGLVLAAALYAVVAFGGGGWGFGAGSGGGPGSGPGSGGKGTGDGSVDPTKKEKQGEKTGPVAKTKGREILVVELLGGARFSPEGKNYLLDRKEPAVGIADVDEVFKKRADKVELHIYYSAESVGHHHNAAERLRDLARQHQIPLVETDEKSK